MPRIKGEKLLEGFVKARYATALFLAVVASFGLGGCGLITPQATTEITEPANGVNGDVGSAIQIRNATLVSDDSTTANLIVSLINRSDSPVTLGVQYRTSTGTPVTEKVSIAARSTAHLGNAETEQVTLKKVDAPAGSLFSLYFQYGTETGTELLVPVLTSEWEEYTNLAPTPTPVQTSKR